MLANKPYFRVFKYIFVVSVLLLLLDIVTTVVILGPLIILCCRPIKGSPIPFLLAAALL